MSLITIPSLVESNVVTYLKTVEDVTYPIYNSFGLEDMQLPCVLVKSGKYTQMEPGTHVFNGRFVVSIITQIDEVEDPSAVHDDQVAEVYDAMEDAGLFTSFDTNGNLWKIWLESIEQEKQDRSLITLLEYACFTQNLTISEP
jgi:hypothetical protein